MNVQHYSKRRVMKPLLKVKHVTSNMCITFREDESLTALIYCGKGNATNEMTNFKLKLESFTTKIALNLWLSTKLMTKVA